MSRKRNALLVLLAMTSGLVGGIMSSQLFAGAPAFAQMGLLPQFFRSRYVQARKGFEVVDNQGKRRVLLDKFGLTFFGEDEKPQITLNVQGPYLTLNDRSMSSGVHLGPSGPCVVRFAQGKEPRIETLPFVSLPGGPKLGCGEKDGKVIWEVP